MHGYIDSSLGDYDLEIEEDSNNGTEIIKSKIPVDSLCWVHSPNMSVFTIVGSSKKYSSPDHTLYKLLEHMHANRESTVDQILLDLDLNIEFKQ